jgi:hypothetical protein
LDWNGSVLGSETSACGCPAQCNAYSTGQGDSVFCRFIEENNATAATLQIARAHACVFRGQYFVRPHTRGVGAKRRYSFHITRLQDAVRTLAARVNFLFCPVFRSFSCDPPARSGFVQQAAEATHQVGCV